MNRFSRVSAAFLSLALLATSMSTAVAAPDSGKTAKGGAEGSKDPQKLFDEAQSLYDKGKFEEAMTRFRTVYEASQSPNARLLIARCLIALGRTVEAYDELMLTRAEAAEKATSQPKYEKTRDSAAADLASLETKVAKVVLTLAEPQGASVTLNEKPLANEKLGVPVTVAPGKISIRVEAPGKTPILKEENVQGGQTRTILITATVPAETKPVDPKPVPLAEPAKPVTTEQGPTSGGGVRVGGFVVAGLGVIGLGVFGATSMMAKNNFDSLVEGCGGKRCTDPSYADTIDEGKRFDVIANASLIAGVASLALGGVMIAIGGPKAVTKTETSLRISPNGGSLLLKF